MKVGKLRWSAIAAQATHRREGEVGHNVQLEDTLRSQPISTQIQEIAEQAIANPEMVFMTLVHHIDDLIDAKSMDIYKW